jgi:hypothetical protein
MELKPAGHSSSPRTRLSAQHRSGNSPPHSPLHGASTPGSTTGSVAEFDGVEGRESLSYTHVGNMGDASELREEETAAPILNKSVSSGAPISDANTSDLVDGGGNDDDTEEEISVTQERAAAGSPTSSAVRSAEQVGSHPSTMALLFPTVGDTTEEGEEQEEGGASAGGQHVDAADLEGQETHMVSPPARVELVLPGQTLNMSRATIYSGSKEG